MILACHGLEKSFGAHTIVKDGNFHIQEREKAALVGINGAGKTTILKMIMKEEPADGGEIIIAKDRSVGCLAQSQDLESRLSIYEEVLTAKADIIAAERQIRSIEKELKSLKGKELHERLKTYDRLTAMFESRNGYAWRSEAVGVLKGLGFSEEDFGRMACTLSGGQKTRVALGKLLLTKPDILLLDEPTNHLDLNSVAWLEAYLINYPGAALVVSHDRFFLNRVVGKVIEIENAKITVYSGGYRAYSEKKRQLRSAALKEYLNRSREIKHHEAVIEKLRSFNREKSIRRAESREKLLRKIEPAKNPQNPEKEIRFSLTPSVESGKDVLEAKGVSKSFKGLTLFENIGLNIRRGEHVALIGDNGTGKTTFLKMVNHIILPDTGSFTFGSGVSIGYYDQERHILHGGKTVFEEISDSCPSLSNTKIRNTLAAFQFTGDDVFKLTDDLSGGEKGRLCLAKLMLSEANFLILDEPTNGLDITSKEILENALNEYTGTVLAVSHDRYFINRTASRVIELANRTFVNYPGNYDYYLEKKEEFAAISASNAKAASSARPLKETGAKSDWQEQKRLQANIRKRKGDFEKTEEKISELEERNRNIDIMMAQADIYTDAARCQELAAEKEGNDKALSGLYKKWEELL